MKGTTLLFAYGTLADGRAPRAVRRALARAARPVGRAWLPAGLYRLGVYPGAVPRPGAPRLEGVLLALPRDPRLWRLLDRYEDVHPEAPARGEFRRERVVVRRLPGDRPVEAWMYVWNARRGGRGRAPRLARGAHGRPRAARPILKGPARGAPHLTRRMRHVTQDTDASW